MIRALLRRAVRALRPFGRRLLGVSEFEGPFAKIGAFIAADKIEGDYLEFGVFSGGSFVSAYQDFRAMFQAASTPSRWNTAEDCARRAAIWTRMRFVAFDSFAGLPEPSGVDTDTRDFAGGKFATSEAEFRRALAEGGVPAARVIVVPGWFADTLTRDTCTRHGLKAAAVVHVDSDLYESARLVLDFVTPLLVDGSVIVFDDWFAYRARPDRGEQRAFAEWREKHPEWGAVEYQRHGPWGISFVLNARAPSP